MDVERIEKEVEFLRDNPDFIERPATIEEFLGEGYLDIATKIRPGIRKILTDIFGEDVSPTRISQYRRAMFSGAIGTGKTTFSSIALPYMVHWILCLKDPQEYFGLLPGSRIAFMQMSTSKDQVSDVVFGDIKARIENSDWFSSHPYDPIYKKSIRFEKEVWILPGDSAETTFEGYNILAGILDEADSHKVTLKKDYAEEGYNTIHSRIDSRFAGRGLLIVIGQMKQANGFAARKFDELSRDSEAYVVRMSLWESYGWRRYCDTTTGERMFFYYDSRRKEIVPDGVARAISNRYIIEVPEVFRANFRTNPEKALRDLAGIPPATADPFISLAYKIGEARDLWVEMQKIDRSPVTPDVTKPWFEPWFRCHDPLKRVVHIDLAYSSEGDALGMAMGHVHELVTVGGEEKPLIVIDFLLRMRAPGGGEIILGDVRKVLYYVKDVLGFPLKKVTLDGLESKDTLQQLRKRRIETGKVSVDRSRMPYEDTREAIYENRLAFPPYMTYLRSGDSKPVEIVVQELTEVSDTGKKIDHPPQGSKDVADAIAGVVFTLMGDRSFRRGVSSPTDIALKDLTVVPTSGLPSYDFQLPEVPGSPFAGGLTVPRHLRPR